jgi:hypothetical protein
MLGKAV